MNHYLLLLTAGAVLELEYHLPLYPDTKAESTLMYYSDGLFYVETTFVEFCPGHGYSLPQKETKGLSSNEAKTYLENCIKFYGENSIRTQQT